MKQQFDLSLWLQDKSRKVVTRNGREVEIVKYDMKGTHFPVLYVISNEDGSQEPCECSKSGMCQFDNTQSSTDLFFADEEETNNILNELKSYLKNTPKEQVEKDWKEIQDWYNHHFTNEKYNEEEELTEFDYAVLSIISDHNSHTDSIEDFAKRSSKKLLDLARKEILKDLPKWKKATEYKEFEVHVCVMDEDMCMDEDTYTYLDTTVIEGEYYIELSDLKTLPKEE